MGNQQPVPHKRKNRNLKPRQKWARRLARDMECNERVKPTAQEMLLMALGIAAVYRTSQMLEADTTRDMDPIRKQQYHNGMTEIRYELIQKMERMLSDALKA